MPMWDDNVTSNLAVKKKRMRAQMNGIRQMLGAEGRARIDEQIAERVCSHPAYDAADIIFSYLSVGTEVDTRAIIRDAWSRGKTVAIPRCVPSTNLMEWYRIEDFEGLETASLGVEEPVADPERLVEVPGRDSGTNAIALVPGYSFDPAGYRLGYGGGFYDVFLPEFGGVSLGLCRRAQYSEEPIPVDEHDVPVDHVIIA